MVTIKFNIEPGKRYFLISNLDRLLKVPGGAIFLCIVFKSSLCKKHHQKS